MTRPPNIHAAFRHGLVPLTCRWTFTDTSHAIPIQYAGLYLGDRALSTGDFLESDARAICELVNESVERRMDQRKKKE